MESKQVTTTKQDIIDAAKCTLTRKEIQEFFDLFLGACLAHLNVPQIKQACNVALEVLMEGE